LDWVKAGKTEFPPILLGTSPFYGLDQFGEKKVSEYARKFDKVEVLAEIIKQAIKTGVEGAHMGSPEIRHLPLWDGHVLPPIYEAFELAEEESGIKLAILPHLLFCDVDTKAVEKFDVRAFIGDGNAVDNYMYSGFGYTGNEELDIDRILSMKKCARDVGKEFGIATHCPATTLPRLAAVKELWDAIKIIMVPINKTGYAVRPRWDESCEEALRAARDSGKAIIAMKVFASGRIPPREGIKYVSRKEYVDAIVLGVGSPEEAKETFQIASQIWKKR